MHLTGLQYAESSSRWPPFDSSHGVTAALSPTMEQPSMGSWHQATAVLTMAVLHTSSQSSV